MESAGCEMIVADMFLKEAGCSASGFCIKCFAAIAAGFVIEDSDAARNGIELIIGDGLGAYFKFSAVEFIVFIHGIILPVSFLMVYTEEGGMYPGSFLNHNIKSGKMQF